MDQTGKAVFFGELLMRLGTKRYERFVQAREFEVGYTGAETNAAVLLSNFGIDTCIVSSVPDTEIGQACINYIRQYGVNTDYVKRLGRRLGTFYLETGASQRPSKVIYDRAGSSITELQTGDIDWDEIFKDKDWFHFSGTAPALGDNVAGVTKEACAAAKEQGLTVSCDLNYREKLWPPEKAHSVMTEIMNFVDVFIGNKEHSQLILGIESGKIDIEAGKNDVESSKTVLEKLHKKFGMQYSAFTLREDISASESTLSGLVFDGGKFYHSRTYHIHIVDRVGGGDAFSGGLIYGLLSGMSMQATVEFATASSCLKHTIHGDAGLMSLNEVKQLMKGDVSGRIQR